MRKKLISVRNHGLKTGLRPGDKGPQVGETVYATDMCYKFCSNPTCGEIHVFFTLEDYSDQSDGLMFNSNGFVDEDMYNAEWFQTALAEAYAANEL